ncbi:MAG: hypothetical protein NWE89_11515 [Candidatus Bathyarchaeota archaeon]|nr:hypothetical protein [Candidatus Bathyarchaeota archaeon]
MPTINIDEIAKAECKPIEVIVGGKTYVIADVPIAVMRKMSALDDKANKGKDTQEDIDRLIGIMSEILGAKVAELEKLGSRKFLTLVKYVMVELSKEAEAKNVPKAGVIPKQ